METGRATQREGGKYSQQDEVREDPSFSSVWKVFLYNKNALQKKRGIRSKVATQKKSCPLLPIALATSRRVAVVAGPRRSHPKVDHDGARRMTRCSKVVACFYYAKPT